MTHSFKLVQHRRFKEAEGSEGGEGGEGGKPNPNPNPNPNPEPKPNGEGEAHKPTDREAELLKEVMKRKESEKSLKGELSKIQEQLKKFDGVDVEQFKSLMKDKADREREELEKRGEFDRVKQQMAEQHQTELKGVREGFEGQVADLQKQLDSSKHLITELTIGRSFGDSAFVRDTLTLTPAKARIVYGSHFELQDGKVVAYDKPAGVAGRTQLVDAKGDGLSFEQAIEKIVQADPDHDRMIRSKVKPGAGSNNDAGTPPTKKVGSGRDRIAAAVHSGALKLPI